MHANKHHLEAANKKASHQQLEARVLEGFAQGLHNGLIAVPHDTTCETGLAQPPGQRHHQQRRQAQYDQGILPAKLAD